MSEATVLVSFLQQIIHPWVNKKEGETHVLLCSFDLKILSCTCPTVFLLWKIHSFDLCRAQARICGKSLWGNLEERNQGVLCREGISSWTNLMFIFQGKMTKHPLDSIMPYDYLVPNLQPPKTVNHLHSSQKSSISAVSVTPKTTLHHLSKNINCKPKPKSKPKPSLKPNQNLTKTQIQTKPKPKPKPKTKT